MTIDEQIAELKNKRPILSDCENRIVESLEQMILEGRVRDGERQARLDAERQATRNAESQAGEEQRDKHFGSLDSRLDELLRKAQFPKRPPNNHGYRPDANG